MAKDKSDKSWFARHKILTVIGAFIIIGVIGSAASGGSQNNDSATQSTTESDQKAEAGNTLARIGEPARDGKFEFVVNSIKCGEKTVGTNPYLQSTASGQFCRLNLSIKNIGDKAQSLFADNQKLLDVQGREYSYSFTATSYAEPNGPSITWYNEINPGNNVTGDILYDIPTDVVPTRVILHDSSFSRGVEVSLQ